MNQQYIPDWSGAMGDTFAPLSGEDDGFIELLWCNGHVVMQSQAALRKPPRPDKAAPAVVADDDAAAAAQAWFQYPVVEDPLERDDLFSELFGEAQAAVDGGRATCGKEEAERGGEPAYPSSRMMPPPPRPAHAPREKQACPGDASLDGAAARTSAGLETTATATEGGDSSMLTIGSSFCGSNHVQTPTPPPRARGGVLPRDATTPPGTAKDVSRARDGATATSSATRSRSCTTKTEQPGTGGAPAAAHRGGKRKQSDATDAEDVEFESADVTCEPAAQKTTTAKRRRAAEVHNQSERRRRDRINEKMKALQQLIPHCNKTDKASMLDEAIDYLKSLQLQLQMMWMGGGMAAAAAAPVVFPAGMHHQYMQRMVAAGPPPPHHVASIPGMPFMAPPAMQGPPPPLPDLYARYLAVDHHLPPPPPPMVAPPYTVQQHCLQGAMGFYQRQNPAPPLPPPPPPPAGPAASPSDGILHKKYENCGKPEIQGMKG